MSKTLSFSKERVRVLVSNELDQVQGGLGPLSSVRPTATAVSSARPPVAQPTATAVSSARPPVHQTVSSVRPEPVHHTVSSVRPQQHSLSSALPKW
jgi:hypothetical protein